MTAFIIHKHTCTHTHDRSGPSLVEGKTVAFQLGFGVAVLVTSLFRPPAVRCALRPRHLLTSLLVLVAHVSIRRVWWRRYRRDIHACDRVPCD